MWRAVCLLCDGQSVCCVTGSLSAVWRAVCLLCDGQSVCCVAGSLSTVTSSRCDSSARILINSTYSINLRIIIFTIITLTLFSLYHYHSQAVICSSGSPGMLPFDNFCIGPSVRSFVRSSSSVIPTLHYLDFSSFAYRLSTVHVLTF